MWGSPRFKGKICQYGSYLAIISFFVKTAHSCGKILGKFLVAILSQFLLLLCISNYFFPKIIALTIISMQEIVLDVESTLFFVSPPSVNITYDIFASFKILLFFLNDLETIWDLNTSYSSFYLLRFVHNVVQCYQLCKLFDCQKLMMRKIHVVL